MRQCPQCNELIQDAAVHCRFCRHDVTPTIASSEKWTEFGETFHGLSAARQQMTWDELVPADQVYVQKVLGIVPPKLPGIREALADLRESRKARKSNNFSGFVVLASFSLPIILGAYFLLPVIQGPVHPSADGTVRALSTSERIDEAIDEAVKTVTALLAEFSGAATDTFSATAVDVASETQPAAFQLPLDTPPSP